jgi:ribosomal protein S18 acetylase RimI-like enzyme
MKSVSLRAADATRDREFARQVHHQAYHDVVVRQFGEWNEVAQDGFFERTWESGGYQIIVLDEIDVGVVRVERADDHIFLVELQFPYADERGAIGSRVLRDLMEQSRRKRVPLRLQVLKENIAQRLYERLGFAVTGVSERHVQMEWAP